MLDWSIEPSPGQMIRLFAPLSYHLQRHTPSPPLNVIYEPAVSPSIPRNSMDPSLLPLSAISPNLSSHARISVDARWDTRRRVGNLGWVTFARSGHAKDSWGDTGVDRTPQPLRSAQPHNAFIDTTHVQNQWIPDPLPTRTLPHYRTGAPTQPNACTRTWRA